MFFTRTLVETVVRAVVVLYAVLSAAQSASFVERCDLQSPDSTDVLDFVLENHQVDRHDCQSPALQIDEVIPQVHFRLRVDAVIRWQVRASENCRSTPCDVLR